MSKSIAKLIEGIRKMADTTLSAEWRFVRGISLSPAIMERLTVIAGPTPDKPLPSFLGFDVSVNHALPDDAAMLRLADGRVALWKFGSDTVFMIDAPVIAPVAYQFSPTDPAPEAPPKVRSP